MTDRPEAMHAPCRGRDEVRRFAAKFRGAFPDLAFGATAELIAEGDYVVGQWEGGGTQTGGPFDDIPVGSLPTGSGKTMRFSGITVLKVENGLITEELGIDDGVAALKQLVSFRRSSAGGRAPRARQEDQRPWGGASQRARAG